MEMPQALEAERFVLGGLVQGGLSASETGLEAADFYSHPHQDIFAALVELAGEDNNPVSPVLLSDFLLSRHRNSSEALLDHFRVFALMQLTQGIPFGEKFRREIRLIKEKSVRRKILDLSNVIRTRALESDEGNGELVESAIELLSSLVETRKSDGFRSLAEIGTEAEEKYCRMAKGEGFNVATGIGEIDNVTRGGIAPGDVWVVGAFTGQGKSALALQMARNQAEQGNAVGIVSREMLDFENFERLHAAKSQTPLWMIRPGMDGLVYDRLTKSIGAVVNLPIFINSQTGNVFELRRQVKKLVERQGIKTLYVDYLQLLEASDQKGSRANEVEKCSRMLKSMAMDFQIGVVALAQYNRLANYAGKAENHSFAESSAIEKDASVVLHLELEKIEPGQSIPKWRKATIRMGKGRQSPQIETVLWFRGECFTFSERNITDLTLASEATQCAA